MKIVVNVDDGGLHPAVRRAVKDLSELGVVTSTTLMANGPDIEKASQLEGVGLGVHLNLLRGKPILAKSEIPSFTDDQGLLLGSYGKLFKKYLTFGINHNEVRKEWSAQIERILDLGVKPTHFDSEKHIHAWPTLMSIAEELAEKYGVKWLRRPHQPGGFFVSGGGGLRLKFLAVCAAFQKRPKQIGWPDAVWGIADQGHDLRPEPFMEYVRSTHLSCGVVEICCHPGKPEAGDGPISGDYGPMRVDQQWKAEYDALSDPEWLMSATALDGRFVNYGQIEP